MVISSHDLFDEGHSLIGKAICNTDTPYTIIPNLKALISEIGKSLGKNFYEAEEGVFISKDANIAKGVTLIGPTVIGHGSELRPGAYIRGGVLIGDGCVIGNSSEIKNSVIYDEAQLPHYNYVGDSFIGYRAHLGAGAIISNLRLDKRNVKIRMSGESRDTGLRKFGALVGDFAEIGCGVIVI